jgi:23S rRNA G2445 N2-methylase RlmL
LTLEREIGGAIWTALEEKHGAKPIVKLKNPDVTIVAELLEPITAVGISRRTRREQLAAA